MRRFDGNDITLAINLVAKNHAVEVIGSHRNLAALTRHLKENHPKTVKMGADVQNGRRYSSFSRLRSEVKRMHGAGSASSGASRGARRVHWLDFLGSRSIDTLFGGAVRGSSI